MRIILFILFVFHCSSIASDRYFDTDTLSPNIPTPESILSFTPGDWHVRHDQLREYLTHLSEASPQVAIKTIGKTYEQRQLLQLTISSQENLAQLPKWLAQRETLVNQSKEILEKQPIFIWLGYSVHGDEASGSHAALLFAYYLAASQQKWVQDLLKEVVIVMIPSLNPDGFDRFTHWVNANRGQPINADAQTREHQQPWPRGRGNHYWFDLNRDWLLQRHPESQAHLALFHRIKPHIVADFHEMGGQNTYFFQPGAIKRNNPYSPKANFLFTKKIAQYHAKAFDQKNTLYYSQQDFDDFYIGKGSTYPDLNGAIGILFEQASARGHQQQTQNGLLTFSEAIDNQLTTSLSTVQAGYELRTALKQYQLDFYKHPIKHENQGYLIHEEHNQSRLQALLSLLAQHQIKAYALNKPIRVNKKVYATVGSYYIPAKQPGSRLIHSIFSQQQEFVDNTFYDVSSWNFASAFHVDLIPVTKESKLSFSKQAWEKPEVPKYPLLTPHYAYAFHWSDSQSASLLTQLLEKNIHVRVSTSAFEATTNTGKESFRPGSIIIPSGLQEGTNWLQTINKIIEKQQIPIYSITSGLTETGIDLGSRDIYPVIAAKPLLVIGEGIDSYEAGELWYYFEQQLQLRVTLIRQKQLDTLALHQYTHLFLVDGDYKQITSTAKRRIMQWLEAGGAIYGQSRATHWLTEENILQATYVKMNQIKGQFDWPELNYGQKEHYQAQQRIAGAVMKVNIDRTHPLFFGYQRPQIHFFKKNALSFTQPEKPFVMVAQYAENPLYSGFTHQLLQNKLSLDAAILAHNVGNGKVMASADSLNFRGFWQGTQTILANFLYFHHTFDVDK